jgi:hypothetical protein
MRNIKFGDFNAGIWIFVLIVYFLFFTLLASSISNLNLSTQPDLTDNEIYYSLLTEVGSGTYSYCSDPRYRYKYGDSEPMAMSVNRNYLRCDWSRGLQSQADCNAIAGCSWDVVDESFAIFGYCLWGCDTYYSCAGTMNVSSYGITKLAGSSFSAPYTYFDYINSSSKYNALMSYLNIGVVETGQSICTHPNVILNQTSCDYFDCTWEVVKVQRDTSIVGLPLTMVRMTGQMFTFSYDFGFENENVNTILYIIFILLPLIFLIIAIIYAVIG